MKRFFGLSVILFLFVFISMFIFACGDDDDDTSSDDDVAIDDDEVADDDDITDDDQIDDDTSDDDDTSPSEPPADPGQTGPYAFGEAEMSFLDPSSNEEQPLQVFYPTADEGASINDEEGVRPLIVFGPGFSAPMNIYFSYGRHLASYGFVVVFRNNYVISHRGLAETTSAIIDWVQIEAEQAGSLFYGKIDFTHIGTTGHSMGGKISLLTAFYDDRITASATIDPVDMSPLQTPDYPSVTPELMPSIDIPTLLVGGSDGGACAPAAENYHEYFLYANPPSIEIEILNSGHVTFCDLPDSVITAAGLICPTGGAEDYEQIRMLTRRYVTAFYKLIFDGEEGYRYYLTGEGIAQDVADGLVETDVIP